jgi:hypothetical protein
MAATTTAGFSLPVSASATAVPLIRPQRRHITPQAGHALEILGHAIEYLTDEYVNEQSAAFSARNEKIEAVQLLMALNRQVYFECPVVPTLSERFRSFLRASLR